MLEWLKRHAWKACKLQKGFGGSNPPLSAKIFKTTCLSSLKHGGRKIFAQDAVGRLWGLRRNPPPKDLVQACLSEDVSKRICTRCMSESE